ncbi:hypothetical protein MRB53_041596 [Persea americana]|nr:hypothetical protein MRB53_041596 [Persea americana]
MLGQWSMATEQGSRDDDFTQVQSPVEVDWDGPNDPDNPRNFSAANKVASILAVTFLAFCTTFAAPIYSPGIGQVAALWSISQETATLPLSIFNLGLAFGPLIGAPLSEQYGRKVVFMVTSPVFALFILGAGLSQNFATLNICRFLAGAFASPAVSNASASITDYMEGKGRAQSLLFYYSIPTSGALLGPLVGGFVVLGKGWRWTEFTVIFFVIAAYVPVLFTKESYKKEILRRRQKKRAKMNLTRADDGAAIQDQSVSEKTQSTNVELGETRQAHTQVGISEADHKTFLQACHHFLTVLFFRPIHMLLTEPIVTLVCVYSGFLFGLLYTFVIASPWIYEHYYGFDTAAVSLTFISLVIGSASAPIPMLLIDHYSIRSQARHAAGTKLPPESRLVPSMVGSLGMPASLFIFAWTVRPNIHWIVPVIIQAFVMLSSVMIYAPTNMFMIDSYGPLYGASASGAAMMSRYALSAAFPLFTLQMYKALGVGWATSLLAFCTLAMAPIPWLFFRYGSALRKRSKYEISE